MVSVINIVEYSSNYTFCKYKILWIKFDFAVIIFKWKKEKKKRKQNKKSETLPDSETTPSLAVPFPTCFHNICGSKGDESLPSTFGRIDSDSTTGFPHHPPNHL